MGQKTNTNLLRLNLEKSNWKSKYYAKTYEESTLYLFKELEIKRYINRIFNIYGSTIHNFKFYYSESLVKIFISFYLTKKYFKMCNKKKRPFRKNFEFTEHLLESLGLFFKKTFSIFLIIQNLNKSSSVKFNNKKLQVLKKICFKLRKFAKIKSTKDFFLESLNILIIVLKKKKTSKILSEFLSFQLKVLRKQNMFLSMIKQILQVLITSNVFSTKGVKVIIKGRLNGAPRARTTTILLGTISTQTFKANINYNDNTAFTRNGTFGVKVWVQESH
jgi:ribosomal protein S3